MKNRNAEAPWLGALELDKGRFANDY